MNVRRHGLPSFALRWVLCAALLSLVLAPCFAAAETAAADAVTVTEVATAAGENEIRYPQLAGMADETVQQSINDAIVEKASIAQRMVTLSTLQSGGTGLTVSYEAYLGGDVFSTVISAKGILENGRAGQSYTALTFQLSDGRAVTLADLFTDVDAAVERMETILTDTYLDELSSYLENAELTPLPTDSFTLDEDGITFYYPASQFKLLSGYCGAAQFNYDELSDELITDADALPARLGALPQALSDEEIKANIEAAVQSGELPHVKARLSESMADIIARYRLLRDPDQYPGGRYFQLEAPAFRQVLVLSDALTSGWQNSAVEGLMSFRIDLYGLKTGVTPRSRWLAVLGEPQSSVAFDADLAYNYGLPTGTADYYAYGDRMLLLYADADDVLYAVRLTK